MEKIKPGELEGIIVRKGKLEAIMLNGMVLKAENHGEKEDIK